jgi:glutamate-1-semialdehyde 2,1-aminomutase
MEPLSTSFAFYAAGAAATAASLVKFKSRLELSRAKHRSLGGHARMSRLFAALVPFYENDEGRFFRADDAPADVAEKRRAGFFRLAALYRERAATSLCARAKECPSLRKGHLPTQSIR